MGTQYVGGTKRPSMTQSGGMGWSLWALAKSVGVSPERGAQTAIN